MASGSGGKKVRVAIYVRVSTIHQVDRDSIPMQKQDLVQYAKLMLGTDDYVIFDDVGYSGKNTMRPKFQEMMSQIRAGLFTHLLVWKIDRISRNLLDFASMYSELKDLGVTFVSKNEQFDTSTAMGEAMLKIILVFAELERNMTSERVTATMISRASNGLWNGGKIPYGYSYDKASSTFSPRDGERELVVLIHDKYEEMRSLIYLSRWLNDRGYRTRAGNEWNPVSIHLILRSVFNAGDYRYNVFKDGNRQKQKDESEWVTIKDHHPAIISHEQKDRVLALLELNTRLHKERGYTLSKNVHVFKGMVFCGNCGKAMTASLSTPKKDGWRYSFFICPTKRHTNECDGKSTSEPIIGEFSINYILNMLNAQKRFANIHSPEQLQEALLNGGAFSYIEAIEPEGLNDLYSILDSEKIEGAIYGKSVSVKTKQSEVDSELARLRDERNRLERAIDRLTNLYLYSDDPMSEREFVTRKADIEDSLDEINEQIEAKVADPWSEIVSDETFVKRASEFIIAQNLADREYISYRRLALSVDATVLRDFMSSVIDRIVMLDGKVKSITFKNGISHTFIFKSK